VVSQVSARFGSLGFILLSLLGVLALPPAIKPTFALLPEMHPDAHRCYGLGKRVIRVTATAYSVGDGMTPGTEVALGGKVWTGTLAVSHDLATLLGSHVCLAGWKYKVRDTMAPEWTRRVDIYVDTPAIARVWGVRELEVRY
jgi:3D (Asp-Asp-Asp) domain-containing protein